jgi:hypothetical protein
MGDSARFRVLLAIGILSYTLFCLPQRYRVDGLFCAFPRAMLCLPVLAALWTVLPLLAWARERGRTLLSAGLGLGLLAYFVGQSLTYLLRDETKHIQAVAWRLDHPNHPEAGGMYQAFNAMAGSADSVAYDGGFGGFYYWLYGPELSRPLAYVSHKVHPIRIPEESKWVVIDRSWNVGWSHPGVTSAADFGRTSKRAPSQEDLECFAQLLTDPAWDLAYNDPGRNQAIFVRKKAPPSS